MNEHAPSSPPPGLTEQVAVRPMERADIPTVIRLAEHIWHLHYPSIISPEQIDYMLADRYAPQALARALDDGHFLLAERRGRLVGFLHAEAPFEPDWPDCPPGPGEGYVHKWYVDPAAHGQGIGQLLWKSLREESAPQTPGWWLRVNRDNVKAVDFYRYLGFEPACTHDLDIGAGFFMNDYVMRWQR